MKKKNCKNAIKALIMSQFLFLWIILSFLKMSMFKYLTNIKSALTGVFCPLWLALGRASFFALMHKSKTIQKCNKVWHTLMLKIHTTYTDI